MLDELTAMVPFVMLKGFILVAVKNPYMMLQKTFSFDCLATAIHIHGGRREA